MIPPARPAKAPTSSMTCWLRMPRRKRLRRHDEDVPGEPEDDDEGERAEQPGQPPAERHPKVGQYQPDGHRADGRSREGAVPLPEEFALLIIEGAP